MYRGVALSGEGGWSRCNLRRESEAEERGSEAEGLSIIALLEVGFALTVEKCRLA